MLHYDAVLFPLHLQPLFVLFPKSKPCPLTQHPSIPSWLLMHDRKKTKEGASFGRLTMAQLLDSARLDTSQGPPPPPLMHAVK